MIAVAIVSPASGGFGMYQVGETSEIEAGVFETVQDYIDYCASECGVDLVVTNEIDGMIYGGNGDAILKSVDEFGGAHYETVYVN